MSLLERMWAYVTLGAMGIVWEEASPLIGGLAAHDRNLRLLSVILAVALGTWLATLALYLLGRWRGYWLRKRWPRFRVLILRSVAVVRRHPWRASFAVRFAYGLRLALPLACGVGRVPLVVYCVGSGASSVAWSLTFSILGWGLGRTTQTLIGHVRELEPLIGAVLVALMVLGFSVLRRRHVAERTALVLDPPEPLSPIPSAPRVPPTPPAAT
jgi:membrane protein DedA with SNARE-associated domain